MKMHPYVEAIVENLKGKEVQVSCGDVINTLKFADYDHNVFNIIQGTVEGGYGDCLIIKSKKNNGNLYINTWGIKMIMPVSEGFLIDVYDADFKRKR